MNKWICLISFAFCSTAQAKVETSVLRSQAEIKISTYQHQLKTTLKANIELGGLKRGLQAYTTLEQNMAVQNVSDKWRLRRTSTTTKNPKNEPDSWEKLQLELFIKAQKDNASPSELKVERLTSQANGKLSYKYMKAITAEKMCLDCHGKSLKETVKEHLEEHYPEDNSVGFELGEVIGAFVLETEIKK